MKDTVQLAINLLWGVIFLAVALGVLTAFWVLRTIIVVLVLLVVVVFLFGYGLRKLVTGIFGGGGG